MLSSRLRDHAGSADYTDGYGPRFIPNTSDAVGDGAGPTGGHWCERARAASARQAQGSLGFPIWSPARGPSCALPELLHLASTRPRSFTDHLHLLKVGWTGQRCCSSIDPKPVSSRPCLISLYPAQPDSALRCSPARLRSASPIRVIAHETVLQRPRRGRRRRGYPRVLVSNRHPEAPPTEIAARPLLSRSSLSRPNWRGRHSSLQGTKPARPGSPRVSFEEKQDDSSASRLQVGGACD
jgi:hypothetical protein